MKIAPVPTWKLLATGVSVSLMCSASAAQTSDVRVLALVNAATGRSASPSFPVAARGSLVVIRGEDLSSGTFTSTTFPIPTEVEGTQVLFAGVAAPLIQVSPTRITTQVPVGLPETDLVDLVVRSANGTSAPVRVALVPQDPGVFEVVRKGVQPVTPLNPIMPGDAFVVKATGLGITNPLVPSGEPPPTSQIVMLETTPLVKVGGQTARVTYASLVADQVGVYEIWAEAPLDLWSPTADVKLLVPAAIGPPGPDGTEGNTGAPGPPGPVGNAGPEGPEGPEGSEGPDGPAGADGADGATGPAGAAGPAGADGADGATGPAGAAGPAGADGADGATGPAGPAGADGADGATGPAGAAGPAGADGADGATGPAGAAGPAGADGADGAAGPAGPAGPAGADGADGATGPAGAAGPAGADGADGATGPAGGWAPGSDRAPGAYWTSWRGRDKRSLHWPHQVAGLRQVRGRQWQVRCGFREPSQEPMAQHFGLMRGTEPQPLDR